jgi:hypothetical protein
VELGIFNGGEKTGAVGFNLDEETAHGRGARIAGQPALEERLGLIEGAEIGRE